MASPGGKKRTFFLQPTGKTTKKKENTANERKHYLTELLKEASQKAPKENGMP